MSGEAAPRPQPAANPQSSIWNLRRPWWPVGNCKLSAVGSELVHKAGESAKMCPGAVSRRPPLIFPFVRSARRPLVQGRESVPLYL